MVNICHLLLQCIPHSPNASKAVLHRSVVLNQGVYYKQTYTNSHNTRLHTLARCGSRIFVRKGPRAKFCRHNAHNTDSTHSSGADPGFCKEGAQAKFCRHRTSESRWQGKLGPQNRGSSGGARAPVPPPRSAPARTLTFLFNFTIPFGFFW